MRTSSATPKEPHLAASLAQDPLTRPQVCFEVRPTALKSLSTYLEAEGPHLSPQQRQNLFLLTHISPTYLPALLHRYQAKYSHTTEEKHPPPRMLVRQRTDQVMRTVLKDKYKDISEEEKERCRKLIERFVYEGDQFLYAEVHAQRYIGR